MGVQLSNANLFFWLLKIIMMMMIFGSFLGKSQDGGIFKTSGCAQKKLCSKTKFYINFLQEHAL